MHRTPIAAATTLTVALIAGLGATACGRGDHDDKAVPAAEMQTQTPLQTANHPQTVQGCLRAGEAADTFVLTAPRDAQGGEPATYVLVGNPSVDLRSHVGQRVEVNGVLRAQQEVATRTTPTAEGRATGTAGTPVVETRTEVALKQLDVSQLRPLGESCDR